MRINIDITGDSASKLSVLAANISTDRKNYIQDVIERHAETFYARLLKKEVRKITNLRDLNIELKELKSSSKKKF